ncbi:hypothetical protein AB0L40_12980 [Patulibacter sp. NPDC049589]|uniref:hypothetical protein n=1 Tax=Patulibacter sp. NPDC049589 TaxID=3154731 RepID=UPI00342C4728
MTALSHLHLRPSEDALLDPLYGSGFRGTDDEAPVGVARGGSGPLRSVDPFSGDSGVARIYTPVAVLDDTGIYGSGPLSGRAPQAFDAFGPDADDAAYPAGADWSDVDRLDA